MSVDILGTNCDQCVCSVQCCFTSTETIRFIRAGSPGATSTFTQLLNSHFFRTLAVILISDSCEWVKTARLYMFRPTSCLVEQSAIALDAEQKGPSFPHPASRVMWYLPPPFTPTRSMLKSHLCGMYACKMHRFFRTKTVKCPGSLSQVKCKMQRVIRV